MSIHDNDYARLLRWCGPYRMQARAVKWLADECHAGRCVAKNWNRSGKDLESMWLNVHGIDDDVTIVDMKLNDKCGLHCPY
jgi:hypothetical protein